MYVIYDAKAKFYNRPFCQINDQIALRSAQDLLETPNTDISRNPEDFTMFCVGTYDDETAQIKPFDIQNVICRFHELTRRPDQELPDYPGKNNPFPPPGEDEPLPEDLPAHGVSGHE